LQHLTRAIMWRCSQFISKESAQAWWGIGDNSWKELRLREQFSLDPGLKRSSYFMIVRSLCTKKLKLEVVGNQNLVSSRKQGGFWLVWLPTDWLISWLADYWLIRTD
jgi:hypothetical protein